MATTFNAVGLFDSTVSAWPFRALLAKGRNDFLLLGGRTALNEHDPSALKSPPRAVNHHGTGADDAKLSYIAVS